ncbi:MAG: beta-propeller fold lactonase family protein [Acidobacteria bacterium]|nr:beta-propeller fold lactonase family protein [Acidobacteriota bacterium]
MNTRIKIICCFVFLAVGAAMLWPRGNRSFAKADDFDGRFNKNPPTASGPIAVTSDDRFVWVVNPDNNSVSIINVHDDANVKDGEIRVGREPNNLAISPDDRWVAVSNTVSGTISIINARTRRVVDNIRVGTEPYGIAFTPNGDKLYVANATSNDISVIDTNRWRVVRTIRNVGLQPRGIAITNDGDARDDDEKVYVTQFFAVQRPGTVIGADDYKEGRVTVISTRNDRVVKEVALAPMADVGFNANGSALKRIPATDPATFTVPTGAFPNFLNAVVIKGDKAYLPNNAASPDGPVRFNVNVQSFLNVIDTTTDKEGEVGGQKQTINMNRGIQFEAATPNRLFLGVPWHIAFKRNSNEGYVVAQAANIVVKVVLDANGTPTINAPTQAGGSGNVIRIPVGQNPRGIVINSTDNRAYVMNEVSRDVYVLNLETNTVKSVVKAADLPPPGTLEARVHIGKAIFHSSTGVSLPELGAEGVIGQRLSSGGWSGCISCHAFGTTDAVVWIFGAGPRRSVHLNGSFNPHNPQDQKILNYSAIFDEVQDFENNIRGVSGGLGLITLADGVTQDPTLNAFPLANTGRSRALDSLAEYVARIRTPISPFSNVAPFTPLGRELALGRQVFEQMGCVNCHSGPGWSSARRDYTPPPAASEIVNGQVIRLLRKVGTFSAANSNEIRQNGAAPLGADGYAPPSLLGVHAMGELFHNGSAETLEDLLKQKPHRQAGLTNPANDVLDNPVFFRALLRFVQSIDSSTPPFPLKKLN